MKIVNYEGQKIRVLKGQTLAIVTTYYEGNKKWTRPSEKLCIIQEEYFKNGNPKKSIFKVISTIKIYSNGYSYHGVEQGKKYDVIERG